jgi:hypothetical protein
MAASFESELMKRERVRVRWAIRIYRPEALNATTTKVRWWIASKQRATNGNALFPIRANIEPKRKLIVSRPASSATNLTATFPFFLVPLISIYLAGTFLLLPTRACKMEEPLTCIKYWQLGIYLQHLCARESALFECSHSSCGAECVYRREALKANEIQ